MYDISESKLQEYVKIWHRPEAEDIEREFERNALEHRMDLAGVIDMHIHIGPEICPRRTDAVELARECRDAGIRAIVIKPFEFCSVERAYFAEKFVPGIKVFGGLIFGRATRGVNVGAVEEALKMGAKAVWLPLCYSEWHTREEVVKGNPKYFAPHHLRRPEVFPVTKDGKVLPELRDTMDLLAKADAYLGTSHIAPEESVIVAEEARKIGCNVVVTHFNSPCFASDPDLEARAKALVERGAWIGFNFVYTIGWWASQTSAVVANLIKAAGPEHSIMYSDAGQPMQPPAPEVMRLFIRAMRLDGLSQAEIDKMTKENPARVLGI